MSIDLDAMPPCPHCESPLHFTAHPAEPIAENFTGYPACWSYACSGCGHEWGNGGEVLELWTYRTAPWTSELARELDAERKARAGDRVDLRHLREDNLALARAIDELTVALRRASAPRPGRIRRVMGAVISLVTP